MMSFIRSVMCTVPSGLIEPTSPVCMYPPAQSCSDASGLFRYPMVSHGARATISPVALPSCATSCISESTTRNSTSGGA